MKKEKMKTEMELLKEQLEALKEQLPEVDMGKVKVVFEGIVGRQKMGDWRGKSEDKSRLIDDC